MAFMRTRERQIEFPPAQTHLRNLTPILLGVLDDRSRLASELDAAAARARSLETTNREVAQRLDAAIDTIRSVLVASEP